MTREQAIKLVQKTANTDFVRARQIVLSLEALEVIKLEKSSGDGVWAVDDLVTVWHGC